ncbi:hypothetical protein [Listeria fleischmannii]|uniref:FtsK/SpoIIIE family protein n=1 Tax=Listeria fleischmannii FSL S10-1203 TaxID=1265822 RepID=W7DIZ2_9LIST|nr:hypothetical protein [Listeria fleischmannii]EUJ65478.1 FtsK/SpoIIIE family protein [Listeria fleischmannii FSL S10-1203]
MVYEYPKGNFRFPVIPDRALNNEEDLQHKPVTKTKTAEVKKELTVKEKFIPTEVPSPVFAFQKRPNRFEFDLDQTQAKEKDYERISLITEEVVEVKEEPKETFSTPVSLEKKRRTETSGRNTKSYGRKASNRIEKANRYETEKRLHLRISLLML